MGVRTDVGLTLVALAVFLAAFVAVGAPLSIAPLLVGSAGTIAFELCAFQYYETVRRIWERSLVQFGTLAGAVAVAIGGAIVAPSIVLSAGIGALATYLLVLVVVFVRRL